jgi:transcription elongation GreA/GreB family factor
MSRAFTKERDDAPEPEPVLRAEPHRITPRGLERLRARIAETIDERRRAQLQRLLDAAIPTGTPDDRGVAGFGARVTVDGTPRGRQTFAIVGEDEIDVAAGLIGEGSPLAQALLGGRPGDRVVWHRPAGDLTLTIRDVSYD